MAVTTKQTYQVKKMNEGNIRIVYLPLAASLTVYEGAYYVLGFDGYVANGTATAQGSKVYIAYENADNSSGSAGDVSSKFIEYGVIEMIGSGFAVGNVGDTVYLSDNHTITLTAGYMPVGTILKYVSSTKVEVALNVYSNVNGEGFKTVFALTAAGDGTVGAVGQWANPTGETIIIENLSLWVKTAPSDTAGGVDAGIAANSTTSSDTLIDGAVFAAAGLYSANNSAGSAGGADRLMTTSQYLNITSVVASHLDLAGLVGYAIVDWRFLDLS